jgi:predicted small lipoprotein YifL/predicted RecA/RadA family phage recombinase
MRSLLLFMLLTTLATGCGKKQDKTPPSAAGTTPPGTGANTEPTPPQTKQSSTLRRPIDRTVASRDLKQIGLAYQNYLDTNGQAPQQAQDLLVYLENNQKLVDAIKDGTYVVYWNVRLHNLPDGTSNTLLGYTWNVPTEGGIALMADGAVKNMKKDEFEQVPKAGK